VLLLPLFQITVFPGSYEKQSQKGKTMEDRVAVISIIVEDPDSVEELNSLLHDSAKYVIGRMGIPYPQKNISIISIAIVATSDRINALTGAIGRLKGVTCKATYQKA